VVRKVACNRNESRKVTLVQTIQSAKSYDEGVSACFWLSFY